VADRQVYLRLAQAAVRANVRRPAYLAVRTASAGLLVTAELGGIAILLGRFGTVGDWRAPEVLVLFGLAFASQGLALGVGNSLDTDRLSLLVRRGTFDQVLTRPVSPLGWMLTSYVDPRFLGRFLAGATAVAWAGQRAGVAWTPARVGVAALAMVSGAAILFGVLLLGGALTFVTVQGSEAVNIILFGGTYVSSFPMQIYGSTLRLAFTWVVPTALAIYVPTLHLLGRDGPPGLPAGLLWATPLAAAAFCGLAGLAWRAGIRHYVGTGS
jgi:ABC-2 type transport system permease protein